jgi:hypothetical protein
MRTNIQQVGFFEVKPAILQEFYDTRNRYLILFRRYLLTGIVANIYFLNLPLPLFDVISPFWTWFCCFVFSYPLLLLMGFLFKIVFLILSLGFLINKRLVRDDIIKEPIKKPTWSFLTFYLTLKMLLVYFYDKSMDVLFLWLEQYLPQGFFDFKQFLKNVFLTIYIFIAKVFHFLHVSLPYVVLGVFSLSTFLALFEVLGLYFLRLF